MRLMDYAEVIRSKNASPFITTLDIFFSDGEKYQTVRDSEAITPQAIAELYKIPLEDVLGIWFVDECLGIKISFLKPVPSDDPTCADLYGAQQSSPLFELKIDQKKRV
ncbi:MAG TPA: DUF4387 domain-containing protein [Firmicutes bacterium]|jgi:hypothetical protein|nr:DUF4387 domain-containing protein [Bacillota bacterium]